MSGSGGEARILGVTAYLPGFSGIQICRKPEEGRDRTCGWKADFVRKTCSRAVERWKNLWKSAGKQ
jgi:hypothetical protein